MTVSAAPPRVPASVSVVIAAHNAAGTLGAQLEALRAQDYPGRFEVIVADNGSTDEVAGYLARHEARERLRLRCVDASGRPGPAHARNIGISSATGDLIAFCDADDVVRPGWLRNLVAAAGHCSLVTGAVETRTLNSETVRRWMPMPPPDRPLEVPGFLRVAMAANMACWADALRKVGGFDESYRNGYEDADLALRVQLSGGTVGHCADALIAYRLRDTTAALWRQSLTYGKGSVQLYADYRPYGMPRRPASDLIQTLALVILGNPLVPERISQVSRGLWLFHAGHLAGRVAGSVHHRCWYI